MGRVRETLHDVLRQTDAVLLALCVASTLYGMVLIASATSFRGTLKYVAVQGLGLLIGLVLYFFLSSIDIFELAKQWKWLLGFNVGFLLLLLTPFGQTRNGNRAWLGVNDIGKNLGVGFLRNFPVTVQPAEVVKIFFIVLLAYQLALLKDRRDLVRFENVIQPTAHTAFMVGLIVVISGDAGSALVYLFIFICMVFAAGMAKRWLALGIGGGAAAFLAVWHLDLLPGYMRDRFLAVLDHSYQPDDAGFQQTRGLMALGSGELTGQGLFHGAQTQSSNVWSIPERQTDFIFSVCGEELGFLGCALIIVLLLAIGIIGVVGGLVMLGMERTGRRNGSRRIICGRNLLIASVVMTVCMSAISYIGIAPIKALYVILPVLAVFYLVYHSYSTEFFVITVDCGAALGMMWLVHRALVSSNFTWLAYAVLIAAAVLTVAQIAVVNSVRGRQGKAKNTGKKAEARFSSNAFLMMTVTPILMTVLTAVVLFAPAHMLVVMGAAAAYLFVTAVYYTVKLM